MRSEVFHGGPQLLPLSPPQLPASPLPPSPDSHLSFSSGQSAEVRRKSWSWNFFRRPSGALNRLPFPRLALLRHPSPPVRLRLRTSLSMAPGSFNIAGGIVRAAVIEVGQWPLKFFGLLMRIRLQGFGRSPRHTLSLHSEQSEGGAGCQGGTAVIECRFHLRRRKDFDSPPPSLTLSFL